MVVNQMNDSSAMRIYGDYLMVWSRQSTFNVMHRKAYGGILWRAVEIENASGTFDFINSNSHTMLSMDDDNNFTY